MLSGLCSPVCPFGFFLCVSSSCSSMVMGLMKVGTNRPTPPHYKLVMPTGLTNRDCTPNPTLATCVCSLVVSVSRCVRARHGYVCCSVVVLCLPCFTLCVRIVSCLPKHACSQLLCLRPLFLSPSVVDMFLRCWITCQTTTNNLLCPEVRWS